MLKEDHDEDFTEAPQVQKHPDPPILASVESKEDDDEIILSKIKSQTVLQSAQQFEKYRKSLQDEQQKHIDNRMNQPIPSKKRSVREMNVASKISQLQKATKVVPQ